MKWILRMLDALHRPDCIVWYARYDCAALLEDVRWSSSIEIRSLPLELDVDDLNECKKER